MKDGVMPRKTPVAHEDDAIRGVRAGLDILAAVSTLALAQPIQVRVGLHTGPVVIGTIGGGEHTEQLALGETPNIAARVQGETDPNTAYSPNSDESLPKFRIVVLRARHAYSHSASVGRR